MDYAYKDYPSIIKSNGFNSFKKFDTKPDTIIKPEKSTLEQILEHVKSIDKKIK